MKISNRLELIFKPIDLSIHRDIALKFRLDAFNCSFDNTKKFWEEMGVDGKNYLEWLETKLRNDLASVVHVWLDNIIVGQIELGEFKQDPMIGYVNLFYLVPEMRGTGISIQLDDYARNYFKKQGCKKMRLSVSPLNLRAVRYYEKMGWRNFGVRPDNPELNFMEKEI